MKTTRGVAILSGGMDSAVALGLAMKNPYIEVVRAVTFEYGQRHIIERVYAHRLARHYGIPLSAVLIDAKIFGDSQLLSDSEEAPRKDTPEAQLTEGVAPTFVPGRNMVMLALAASFAAKHGANVLVGGWHQEDYSGYPDCRDAFLTMMQLAINEALGRDQYGDDSIWIYAPLIDAGKDDIVALARGNDVPLELTWSCYDPVVTQSGARLACGRCDACQLRIRGFRAAGWIDPVPYAIEIDWKGAHPWPVSGGPLTREGASDD